MSKVVRQSTHGHKARKTGARRVIGVAGRPLKLSPKDEAARKRHAVRRRPPVHERLAARVKKETKRLEPPKDKSLGEMLSDGWQHLREAVLPNDPRDIERREQTGEPVMVIFGAVDLVLFLSVVVLLVIGTVMVYSASMVDAYRNTNSTSYYLFKQTQWLLVGGVGMYIAMRLDYRHWRHLAGVGLVLSIVLLMLLHTRYGVSKLGATRWLHIGPFEGQPSDFAKLALVLYAAYWFSGQRAHLRHSLRGLLPFGVVVGYVTSLVLREPDLGTTVVIAASLLTVYFVSGARMRHLILLLLVVGVGGMLYLHYGMHGYQRTRLEAFFNPDAHAQDAGWHYQQLKNALGLGGLTGVGLGNGVSKYTLPEPYTDSIFAIIGEELGLVGTVGVLGLFMLFAIRGLRASILAPDAFGRILATGITCSIVFQALINMAVAADMIPFTGVPLPFISYGGSSLSISMIATGILLNISKQAIDVKEGPDPAPTHFWRRHRRAYLPLAGGRQTPVPATGYGRREVKRVTGR